MVLIVALSDQLKEAVGKGWLDDEKYGTRKLALIAFLNQLNGDQIRKHLDWHVSKVTTNCQSTKTDLELQSDIQLLALCLREGLKIEITQEDIQLVRSLEQDQISALVALSYGCNVTEISADYFAGCEIRDVKRILEDGRRVMGARSLTQAAVACRAVRIHDGYDKFFRTTVELIDAEPN